MQLILLLAAQTQLIRTKPTDKFVIYLEQIYLAEALNVSYRIVHSQNNKMPLWRTHNIANEIAVFGAATISHRRLMHS